MGFLVRFRMNVGKEYYMPWTKEKQKYRLPPSPHVIEVTLPNEM